MLLASLLSRAPFYAARESRVDLLGQVGRNRQSAWTPNSSKRES